MKLIPLRPSLTVSTEVIRNQAQEQNKLNTKLEHRVVRGITNLDIKLAKKRGEKTKTFQDFFLNRDIPQARKGRQNKSSAE